MMDITTIFIWVHDSYSGVLIRENDIAFPWIESIHILSDVIVLGSIAMVDLRLVGLLFVNRPFGKMADQLLHYTWGAFVVAAMTGALLFVSNAINYTHNSYFQIKMLLLGLAGINMLVFQILIGKDRQHWGRAHPIPRSARLAGLISLTLWIGIIFCGRWIGFTIEPTLAG